MTIRGDSVEYKIRNPYITTCLKDWYTLIATTQEKYSKEYSNKFNIRLIKSLNKGPTHETNKTGQKEGVRRLFRTTRK